MTKPGFPEWFCLADGRRNFQIDPVRDSEFLFGESEWERDIVTRLKRAQLLGEPVRLVWWGQYGIGKTHRLRHTAHLVNERGYNYLPAYVVASDIQDKAGFDRLHFELLNALSKDRMRQLVSAYLLKLRTDASSVPALRDICSGNGDVESALRSFGGDNEQLVTPAWRFLSGLALKGNDLALANVTKSNLDSSLDFTAVLAAFATILQRETGKELLFLVDECENIGRVTNKAAINRWQETIRALLDIRNISLVLTVGAERQDNIPQVILQADIVRRIQKDNYVQMAAFTPPVARKFLEGLLSHWIDAQARDQLLSEGVLKAGTYEPKYYPFSRSAFDKFCDWAVVDPRAAKPSVIIDKLNNLAAEAYFSDERLITGDTLTSLGIA